MSLISFIQCYGSKFLFIGVRKKKQIKMAPPGATSGDSNGDWQEVRRRKPYPNNWRPSQPTKPKATPYQPYAKPTYAQMLRRSPPTTTMLRRSQLLLSQPHQSLKHQQFTMSLLIVRLAYDSHHHTPSRNGKDDASAAAVLAIRLPSAVTRRDVVDVGLMDILDPNVNRILFLLHSLLGQ